MNEKAGGYYNENNPASAETLLELIAAGLIPPGDVDTRSIADVGADDVAGYAQVHLFAGTGGWALAARLAGWPDGRPLWTGSDSCQPWSAAGKGLGFADPRYLWPHMFRLLRALRPACWLGEQVARKAGFVWTDRIRSDLESIDYAARTVVIPACAVGAPHDRPRQWTLAHPVGSEERREESRRWPSGRMGRVEQPVSWDRDCIGALPEFRVLDHGLPRCVAATDAARNAIVPVIGAEVIAAYADYMNYETEQAA